MSVMTWDYDICLSCDNHTHNGDKYCSQACRLLDMERGGQLSEPATPALFSSDKPATFDSFHLRSDSRLSLRSEHPSSNRLSRSAEQNLSLHGLGARYESPPASPRTAAAAYTQSRPQTSCYFFTAHSSMSATSQPQPIARGLTLSPSRSSLSSVSSSASGASSPGLSQEMLDQLRDYSGAFDQTRDWRRRRTMG